MQASLWVCRHSGLTYLEVSGSFSLGFLYLMMGVIISSAVLPATLTLMWTKQNKWAAMLSPPLGLLCSLIAWLVTAAKQSGNLSVDSLGANYPMLGGLPRLFCSFDALKKLFL
jgi:Na+/proline symporter